MDLKDLLNRNDFNKLRVLELLMNTDHPLTKRELAKTLRFSDFLIDNYLEDLGSIAQTERFGITLIKKKHKNSETYSIQKADLSNLKFIVFYFFEQSIDYQLLSFLQQKPGCSLPFLSEHFYLSESVLYSHFQRINRFLETYGIQIKKGQLTGPVLNIYYFFYYFYWFTLPLQEIKNRFYKTETERIIHYLEKKLNIVFPETIKIQLHLWCSIASQYSTVTSVTQEIQTEFMSSIRNDFLYQTIRTAYFTLNSSTAFPGNESFPLNMYIFLTSIYILPAQLDHIEESEDFPNYVKLSAIVNMNHIILKDLSELHISLDIFPKKLAQDIYYLLAQAHGQLFYFKRYVSTLNPDFFLSGYPFDHKVPKLMRYHACALTKKIERVLEIKFDQHTFDSIRYIYLTILKEAEQFSTDKITIGVFCYSSYLRANLLAQQLLEVF